MKLLSILLAAASIPLQAQWLNYPEVRTPHTRDGKPDLAARVPRTGGKPNLSGVWRVNIVIRRAGKNE